MENVKKIEYPRYTREQNLSCKLTDRQIEDIRKKKGSGWKIKHLMKLYSVSKSTILYWTSDYIRNRMLENNRRLSKKRREENPEKSYIAIRKYILRKKKIQGKEFNAYNRITKNTDRVKLRNKLAWEIVKRHKKEYRELLKNKGDEEKNK